MLGKIDVINYERCYPKRLKKYFQSKMNYKTYADFVPYTERATVGNIPKEIIRLFEPNERGTKIKAFQSALAETAQTCRKENNTDKAREVLSAKLKEVIPEISQVEMEYIGYGGYKDVYRIGLKDTDGKKIMHDKALLVYKINNAVLPRKSHGLYAEPNSWYYLQKNMGHPMDSTQFTKHYISDMKNGYTVTEFIDNDITKTTDEFDHNRILGLILTDSQNNPRHNKKVYDIGGLLRISDTLEDITAIKYFKKIANRKTQKEREEVAARLTEKAKNPKTPLRDKIQEALDYYNGLPPWYWSRTSERIPIRMIW